MIRITDMTLSCLDEYKPSRRQLTTLLKLLPDIGVDIIELSSYACETIGDLPENGKYILRVKSPGEISQHSHFNRFVCRKSRETQQPSVTSEIQVNDIREINFLSRSGLLENVRITGLDDILNHDYERAFAVISDQIGGRLELCPENNYYCATAIAVEWVLSGGTDVVTSFGGVSNKAPTEEVLMSLRIIKRHKVGAEMTALPRLASVLSEITSEEIPDRKAVIGGGIFDVESGIHVDGILKKPQMYESFLPELVGGTRQIVLGKYSGRAAVLQKLGELGLRAQEYDIAGILAAVKNLSIEENSSVSDSQLLEISELHRN